MDFEKFWPCFGQFFGLNLRGRFQKFTMYIVLNAIFDHICEFSQNPYVGKCTFLYWFYVLVLNGGYPLGVARGVNFAYCSL